ncbi:MAG: hypothetical protein LBV34_28740, partial [Nocardiopsaceae bacterium]|nr:hypothetical protein [Nocardiopsaceae bacterium]
MTHSAERAVKNLRGLARETDVKALVFRNKFSREAAATIAGQISRRAFVSRIAPVRIEDIDEPPLPDQDWVRVETACS